MRFLLNFLLRAAMVMLFGWFGWVEIATKVVVFNSPLADKWLTAGILGLAITFAAWILIYLATVFGAVIGYTQGGKESSVYGAIIALVVVILAAGPLAFPVIDLVFPGWLTVTTNWFFVCVMGWAFLIIELGKHTSSSKKK